MICELMRLDLGLPSLHRDLDTPSLLLGVRIDSERANVLVSMLDNAVMALDQNVQPRLAYEWIFAGMANL